MRGRNNVRLMDYARQQAKGVTVYFVTQIPPYYVAFALLVIF